MRKSTQTLLFLVISLLIGTCVTEEIANAEAQPVPLVDENALNNLIKSERLLVILFQKEGKDASRNLNELQTLQSLRNSSGLEYTVGVWSAEVSAAVSERFKLKGLPALRVLFDEGRNVEEYKSFIESEKILSFLKRNYKRWTNRIVVANVIEDLEAFANSNVLSLVFFGDPATNQKEYALFEKLFRKFSNVAGFARTNSADISSLFNVSQTPDILFLNRNDVNSTYFLDLPWDEKSLERFFNTYAFKPLIVLREEADYESLFVDQEDILFYARLGPGDPSEKEFNRSRTFYSEKARMVVVDAYSPPGRLLYSWLRRNHEDAPNIFFVKFEKGNGRKYELQANITKENLIEFYENITNAKISPIIQSGRVPEQNDGVIKTVVRNNWDAIVADPTKHVCLTFYSHQCRHCTEFRKTLEKVAKKYSSNADLVFAELNITENDLDDITIKMVPSVYFYLADQKKNPIEFVFKKGEESFVTFIENTLEDLQSRKKRKSKKKAANKASTPKKDEL